MTAPALTGTTTGGLPYPESTGALNQGANDIKALALAVEARGGGRFVQSGELQANFTGATATLTFPTPFKAGTVPTVLCGGGTGSAPNNTSLLVGVISATPTGVVVTGLVVSGVGAASAWASNGFSCKINFIAVGTAP